ncbi:agmatine deiminase family protein [Streptomyces coffeae]|uniref:Agmatine deiminase family protein n=1 Tax=Streptomyces coffeae TaxID=621382 RepID=A0ABS1NBC7_9ACTN|nr:agmatine deiminase family protein [Streptomyces coffeae]MBL1097358.1 agmatine deiminase family protein [Streptomyces coffeae]
MRGSKRRTVLRSGAAAALAGAAAAACSPGPRKPTTTRGGDDMSAPDAAQQAARTPAGRWMPAETARHRRTYMAWPSLDSVWEDMAEDVQRDIAGIAQVIAGFESVVLLAAPEEVKAARRACGADVEVIPVPVDDLWIRDSGPTFVIGRDGLTGIDLRFNGWGGKQRHPRDARVARSVTAHAGGTRLDARLTGEGGALEVDGHGTLMATESSLVNANRNPGLSRDRIEARLKELLGVTKVIWFKGVKGKDITDCHVDALARFAGDGVVLLSRPRTDSGPTVWSRVYAQARSVLEKSSDALGRPLKVVDLPEPDPAVIGRRGSDFLGAYANYFIVNGGVIVPRFGDPRADREAAAVIGDLHPGRKVVQVEIPAVAEGGGGIHCATQQQPDV